MEVKPQEPAKTTAVKATEAARKVGRMVKGMYARALEAKAQGIPVAYCMVGSLYDEILRAMDIAPIWTENYAGVCAAKRATERFFLKAESLGYSPALCGYARVGIGFDILRQELGEIPDAPWGGMARPDLLLGSSSACDPRFKWYQASNRFTNLPIFNVDVVVPPVEADLNQVRDYYVAYQAEELRELVHFLEETTGKKLDRERLWQVIAISDEMEELSRKIRKLRKTIPSPMPSEDHFNTFVPMYFLRGTTEGLDYYRELYQEVKERAEKKIGVIPEEKYRLMWAMGLPPWHTMWMCNYFESQGAVLVIEATYRPGDAVEVPSTITDPIEYIAYRHFLHSTYRHEKAKRNSWNSEVEFVLETIRDFHIGGMVMHGSKSCRATTIGQLYLKNSVHKYYPGMPALQIISDMVDIREYSEADFKGQIDAFIAALAGYKESRLRQS